MKTTKRLSTILAVLILLLVTVVVSVSATEIVYPESDHNYGNDIYDVQTYNHTDYYPDSNIDYLNVTFSSYTYIESGYDYIYIYALGGDMDGELVGAYTGYELSGTTIRVDAPGFEIILTSDFSGTDYGYKIVNIEGCTVTDISNCKVTLDSTTVFYDYGSAVSPTITVTDGDTTLQKDVDYSLYYENNTNIGTATVYITGIGRYKGEVSKTYKIVQAYPESDHYYYDYGTWTYTYDDSSAEYLEVKFSSQTAIPSYYYIYLYYLDGSEYKELGKYSGTQLAGKTITVPGNCFKIYLEYTYSSYYGFKVDSVTGYKRTNLRKCTVTLSKTSVNYNASAQKPTVTVKNGNVRLVKDTDYTVSYKNNVDIGTATVTIKGIGKYKGTVTKNFTIARVNPESDHNYANNTTKTWKYPCKTTTYDYVKVKFSSKTSVQKNKDYIYIYTLGGTLVGKYTGTELAGKTIQVNSSGFKVKLVTDSAGTDYGFKVESITGHKFVKMSSCKITLSATSYTYDGTYHKPSVTVKYGSKTLKKDTDYKVTYSDYKNAGTAKVKITGLGAYSGSVTKNFTIKKLALSKVTISSISNQKYTGKAIKPTITVKTGGKKVPSSNYTVKYSSNTKVGTATVTITAKGSNTSGSKKITFKIVPHLSATTKKLYKGKSFTLKLNGIVSSKVKFSSSKTSVCTVNSSGVVKAKKTGTATIYAKYNGVTYKCKVTVKLKPSLSVTKKNMYEGKSFTLKLNNATLSDVKFSSSNTSVCTVSSKGVVKGIEEGSATIYAKYDGVTYECAVTVLEAGSSSSTEYYKNHDDVPDFGALAKISPTSSSDGSIFVYSLSDLQNVDPDQELGDKYSNLLVKEGFTKASSTVKKSGKYYYKFTSEKKIVYFGIASKNGEVKIIIELK